MELEAAPDVPLSLPPAAELALRACSATWHDGDVAEGHLRHALAVAPDALAVRIGAYKFYFYRNRLAEAAEHARGCLDHAARLLGIAADWQQVGSSDAAFDQLLPMPRFYLQCLLAYGYCRVRLGDLAEGRAVLVKAGELDPADRLGARRLVAVIDRGGVDEDA